MAYSPLVEKVNLREWAHFAKGVVQHQNRSKWSNFYAVRTENVQATLQWQTAKIVKLFLIFNID